MNIDCPPEDMDGKPPAFLARKPVAQVASHETKRIERIGEVEKGSREHMLEELRAIGYIECPGSRFD